MGTIRIPSLFEKKIYELAHGIRKERKMTQALYDEKSKLQIGSNNILEEVRFEQSINNVGRRQEEYFDVNTGVMMTPKPMTQREIIDKQQQMWEQGRQKKRKRQMQMQWLTARRDQLLSKAKAHAREVQALVSNMRQRPQDDPTQNKLFQLMIDQNHDNIYKLIQLDRPNPLGEIR